MSRSLARRRGQRAVIAAVVAVAVLVPLGAHALTPTFPDVPADHAFFDEIEWMNDTGVTEGFPDGTFKPNQPVTRGSMSAFMQRLYDVQEDLSWNTGSSTFSGFAAGTWTDVPAAQGQVTVPDGVNANLVARFTAESSCAGGAEAPWCAMRIVFGTAGYDGPMNEMYPVVGDDYAFDAVETGGGSWEGHAFERFAYGNPGTTYYFKVQGQRVGATSMAVDDWSFAVETDLQPSDYIPF